MLLWTVWTGSTSTIGSGSKYSWNDDTMHHPVNADLSQNRAHHRMKENRSQMAGLSVFQRRYKEVLTALTDRSKASGPQTRA